MTRKSIKTRAQETVPGTTAMIDQDKKREAMQRAAEHRQRAAQYEALSEESKQRGEFELSSKFASNAYEERNEARKIEDGVSVGVL